MIKTESDYKAIWERVEELLENGGNIEDKNSKGYIELNILSDLIVDYEETNFPVKKPTLAQVVKMRMAEMDLNKKRLSESLGVSTSRVSEHLKGKMS